MAQEIVTANADVGFQVKVKIDPHGTVNDVYVYMRSFIEKENLISTENVNC